MSKRRLYIAAYDVASPTRLRQALKVLKGYSSGGQKSVFECFLTEAEKEALLIEVEAVLELAEDRFLLLPLRQNSGVHTLGIAVKPRDEHFYYVG